MGSFIQRWGSTWGNNVLVAVSLVVLGGGAAGCGVVATDVSAHSQGDSPEPEGEKNNSTPVMTEDGRMLKPDGYVGLWFETEPTDPWEHYVWLSQKYVGDPVHLGELGPGEAHDNFVGEPDICSDEVIARMKEIGFEGGPGIDEPRLRSCDFEYRTEPDQIFPGHFSINQPVDDGENNMGAPVVHDFGPGADRVLYDLDPQSEDDLSYVSIGRISGSNHRVMIATDETFGEEKSKEPLERAYFGYWIAINLGILEGNNDQI